MKISYTQIQKQHIHTPFCVHVYTYTSEQSIYTIKNTFLQTCYKFWCGISNILMVLLSTKQKLSQVLKSINPLYLVNLVMMFPIQFKNHLKVVTFKPIIIQLISVILSWKKAAVHQHICKLHLITLFSSEKGEALFAMQFVYLTTQMLINTCALDIISFWVTQFHLAINTEF